MAKYLVTLEETVRYTVEVEAGSLGEAEEKACELWSASTDPTRDFDGIGCGVEAAEWKKIRED